MKLKGYINYIGIDEVPTIPRVRVDTEEGHSIWMKVNPETAKGLIPLLFENVRLTIEAIRLGQEDPIPSIRQSVQDFYAALDQHKNANTARAVALKEIQAVLGMKWEEGATLK